LSADTVRRWPARAAARGRVLVVHGLGDHAGRHTRLAEALAAAGYDVAAGDLRGHGKAPGPRGHAERWSDLLADVESWWRATEAPGAARPFYLFGESLGALVALDWALAHPERPRALVLAAPAFRPGFDPPSWKLALARVAAGVAPAFAQKTGIGGAMITRVREESASFDGDPLVHQLMSARLYVLYLEAAPRLAAAGPRVAWPTLVLGPGDDRVASLAAMRAFAASNPARIEMREYPQAFHALFHDTPEIQRAATADVIAFLERHS
jgi:alpha-beta hydrolase superfamily lysophospholipase